VSWDVELIVWDTTNDRMLSSQCYAGSGKQCPRDADAAVAGGVEYWEVDPAGRNVELGCAA